MGRRRAFDVVDVDLSTEYRCPSCHYEWSGRPRPGAADDVEQPHLFEPPAREVPLDEPAPDVEPDGLVAEAEGTDDGAEAVSRAETPIAEPDQLGFEITDHKPPFAIPPLAVIKATPNNGFTGVSTFSGCGGACLGYRWAGFDMRFASEFIPAAGDTYEANHDTHLDRRDIRQVLPQEVLDVIGLDVGELDLLEGSPPCASFSTSGKLSEGWGEVRKYSDTKQRTDDLFFEFARLVDGLRPKVFVAENVKGLTVGVAKGYFKQILEHLRGLGYRVEARVLDAQWLGVPQARERLIFVGVRKDLKRWPVFPEPLPYRYTVAEAIPWLKRLVLPGHGFFEGADHDLTKRPSSTIAAIGMPSFDYFVEAETDITKYAIGREWDNVKQGESSDVYFNLTKPDPDKPAPTITQTAGQPGAAGIVHPTEKRKFSIMEVKRLFGFPDDFVLTGTFTQQWERLGRSVPPPMAMHIASTVRDRILS